MLISFEYQFFQSDQWQFEENANEISRDIRQYQTAQKIINLFSIKNKKLTSLI